MILFVKLLLAHLIADFILQPAKWVARKEKFRLKSREFYMHIAIHFICMVILVWNAELLPIIAGISLSHGLIDFTKLKFQKNKSRQWFFIDQVLHVLIIAVFVFFIFEPQVFIMPNMSNSFLFIITGAVLLTMPTSIIIRNIISFWASQINFRIPVTAEIETKSLQNAGMYIGILERILVFVFILVGHWEAVGFLITAKSVFRFSDLKQGQDRKLTEYILIGTLLSFGIAILSAITVQYLLVKYP